MPPFLQSTPSSRPRVSNGQLIRESIALSVLAPSFRRVSITPAPITISPDRHQATLSPLTQGKTYRIQNSPEWELKPNPLSAYTGQP